MNSILIFIIVSMVSAAADATTAPPHRTRQTTIKMISDNSITLPDYALSELFFAIDRSSQIRTPSSQPTAVPKLKLCGVGGGTDNIVLYKKIPQQSNNEKAIVYKEFHSNSPMNTPPSMLLIDVLSPVLAVFLNIFLFYLQKYE